MASFLGSHSSGLNVLFAIVCKNLRVNENVGIERHEAGATDIAATLIRPKPISRNAVCRDGIEIFAVGYRGRVYLDNPLHPVTAGASE